MQADERESVNKVRGKAWRSECVTCCIALTKLIRSHENGYDRLLLSPLQQRPWPLNPAFLQYQTEQPRQL